MNEDLIQLLARCVREGWINNAQALQLLRRADLPDLPLPAWWALGIDDIRTEPFTYADDRDGIQALFEKLVVRLGEDEDALARWQLQFKELVTGHIVYQAIQIFRMDDQGWALLKALVQTQLAYLSRFADQRWLRQAQGAPMSPAQIAQRSRLYSGSGRAAAFQFAERRLDAGYVVDYQARDDARTCSPCIGAEQNGPYLPGDGPMPGAVCLGAGMCRCVRVSRYAPAEARRLQGGD